MSSSDSVYLLWELWKATYVDCILEMVLALLFGENAADLEDDGVGEFACGESIVRAAVEEDHEKEQYGASVSRHWEVRSAVKNRFVEPWGRKKRMARSTAVYCETAHSRYRL